MSVVANKKIFLSPPHMGGEELALVREAFTSNYIAPVGPIYQAGTLSANPVAMAAGAATMNELLKTNFYADLELKTRDFIAAIQNHADRRGLEFSIPSIGSIFWIAFSRQNIQNADEIDPTSMEKFKTFHLECIKRGVYFGPSGYEVGFVSAAHSTADLEEAASKICAALDETF